MDETNNQYNINLNELNDSITNNDTNTNFDEPKNIIKNINDNWNIKSKEAWINLDKISIEESNNTTDKLNNSITNVPIKEKKHYHLRYRKIFSITFFSIILSRLIFSFFFFANKYIKNYPTNNETTSNNFINTLKNFITPQIEKFHNSPTINLVWWDWASQIAELINSDLNYIQKKERIKKWIKELSTNIIWNYTELNNLKKDITKYWYFPKSLWNIISESEPITSIQSSLTALEAIKFSSAISVFSNLDTFIESISKSTWIEKDEIKSTIKKITSRWESDINLYIKNCYLNPFETEYECNYIWDFNTYYNIIGDNIFDKEFFKTLIKYTDSKLEQTDIPSFTITFKEFNQNNDQITFEIEINTFKEDESELAKQWILSPHIFIFNNLINNLKQSRFIVWDDISVKSIDVNTESLSIGSKEINVKNSKNTFTVHIKKENEIEIDDYVY